ncbi:MAG: DUF418 domain-containing protein [Xanthomonadaceae bacterium]|nr:DUF418 domain-containing protein [Xanthomonadaceae bacterium]
MHADPVPTLLSPVQPGERIEVMDVLRGFALLGILLMNIEGFVGPLWLSVTGLNPELTGANRVVDWLIYVLVQGKFMTLFSLLFGMGFAVMLDRAQSRGDGGGRLYARRLLALLGFGIVHAVLLWAGDVLISYALVGFAMLLLFRNTKASRLPIWAVSFAIVLVGTLLALGLLMQVFVMTPEGKAMLAKQASDAAAMVAAERQAYGGGSYLDATIQRIKDTLAMLGALPVFGLLILVMFLLGAWLVRAGIMRDTVAHARLFRRMLLLGMLVGLPLMLLSATMMPTMEMHEMSLRSMGWQSAAMIAGVLMSLGYASAIVLAMHRPAWRRRLSWLAPAGRMALTNYLMQSVVCTTIFYGYGLDYFEQLPRAWQPLFVAALFGLQVWLSRWWLSRYRYGPMEWLWRWMTYGARQPMRLPAIA